MTWTNNATLTPADRVKLIVGGNFTLDALGPVYEETLAALAANPQEHFRAFEQLYLRRAPSRRTLTELFLPSFLKLLQPHLPDAARRAAQALLARSGSLARAQETALGEANSETASNEIARQQRQLGARIDILRRIAGR